MAPPYLSLTFNSDSVRPAVSIQSVAPAASGQTPLYGPLNIAVSATDAVDGGGGGTVQRVELFVDNVQQGTATTTGANGYYNFTLNTNNFLAGHHRIHARAYDAAGNYNDSSFTDVTFQGGLITPPANLTVTPTSATSYQLTWAPSQAMRPSAGASPAPVTYSIFRSTSATANPATLTPIAQNLTGTSYSDSPGVGTFYYWVRATDSLDGAQSAFSAVGSVRSPAAPWGLLGAQSGGTMALSWQPSPNSFTDPGLTYTVYRSSGGGAATAVASGLTATTWTDAQVSSGTTYTYQVSAVNRAGQESPRTESYTLTASSSGPDAPRGVQAVAQRGRVISVLWNAADSGVTYNLYRSTDRSTWSQIATGINGWFYNDTDLNEGTTYYYQVEPVSGGQAGPRSAIAGAMAVAARRLGIDSRFPVSSVSLGAAAGYLNLNNGNLALNATDSIVTAPYLPVVIRRIYNSQGPATGSLGNWRLDYDWTVEDFGSYAVLTTGDGAEHIYTLDEGGNYQADSRWYWTLTRVGGTFQLTRPDRIQYTFNSQGQVATISDRNLNTLTFHYDGSGRLVSITDPVNRTTSLQYNALNLVSSITDSAGRTTTYGYDSSRRLTSVTDAEGGTTTYQYDALGRLVYAADPGGNWTALAYDDTGRVAAVTDALGNATGISYDSSSGAGSTTTVTDPLQARTTFVTDAHGYLTSTTDALSNTWSFAYTYMLPSDPNKLQTMTATAPNGLTTTITFDTTGNPVQVADVGTDLTAPGVSTRTMSMSYLAGSSDLVSSTDYAGKTTTNTWSATPPYQLLSTRDPLSNTVQYSYGSFGYISGVTDPRGNATTYGYDANGNLTAVFHAMGGGKSLVQSMTYYADGSVETVSELHDPNTANPPVTWYSYDNLGRSVRTEYPDGSAESWLYDPSGRVALHVDRGGQRTSYSYDLAGRLSVVTDTAGNTTQSSYDAGGNLTAVTDANQHTTTTSYDSLHRVTQRRSPMGMVQQYSYDAMGNVTTLTSGHQSIIASSGYQVTATYYQTGLLRQVSEPLNSDSMLLSDGSTPGSNTTVYHTLTYDYNLLGKVLHSTEGTSLSAGQAPPLTTTYAYDDGYRLLTVTDANGGVTEYAYDANGNRTDVWDPEHTRASGAASTHFSYDALNRLISTTDPLGNVSSQTYDDAGNVATRTEPRKSGSMSAAANVTTIYGYDLGHRLTSISYANATGQGPLTPTNYLYDGGGRRLFRRDDTGMAIYSYDSLGRLSTVLSPQENDSFGYDAVGNRTSVTYSIGTVAYQYDADNRLMQVTDPLNNTTQYSYDNYGHVSQLALPNGITRSYTYWALPGGPLTSRLKSLATTKGSTNYWTGSTYQYDFTGNVRKFNVSWNQTPSSYSITATYDTLNRLTQWTDTSISDTTIRTSYFTYDKAGNRLTWGNLNNTASQNFQTPNSYRWPGSNTYNQGPNVVNQYATYNSANRVSTQYTSWGDTWQQLSPSGAGIVQEPNGNAYQEEYGGGYARSKYTFNDANQLTKYHAELNDPGFCGGNTNAVLGWSDDETYTYDGDGRRTSWSSNFTHGFWYGYTSTCYPQSLVTHTTSYKAYEYVGSDVVAERSQGGAVTVWYIYGAGGDKLYTVHWSTSSSSLTADVYAKDHLGSIREVIDSSGTTQNSYNYDAFGLPTAQTVRLANSYQFAAAPLDGIYYQDATGSSTYRWFNSFYNLKARVYDPAVGRFLTQDTYRGNPWQPWTQNLYSYAGNNPVNYVDPTGHVTITNTTWLGNLAHHLIEVNLAVQMASAGWMPHVEQNIPGAGLRPDIWGENLTTAQREVYEIKPATVLGDPARLADANLQINQYADALDATRGTTFAPSKTVFSMGIPGVNYVTLRTFTVKGQPGLVFYEWQFQSLLPEAAAAKLLQKALDKLKQLADQIPPTSDPDPQPAYSDEGTSSPSTPAASPPSTIPAPPPPPTPPVPIAPSLQPTIGLQPI